MKFKDELKAQSVSDKLTCYRQMVERAANQDEMSIAVGINMGAYGILLELGFATFAECASRLEEIVLLANEREKILRKNFGKVNLPFERAL